MATALGQTAPPPAAHGHPHLTDSEAPPPSHRGRCRRHYLRSTRRARRARCLRGGRKVPSWPGLPPGEQCPNPTLLSSLSQTALSFPPFVTISGHPAPAFQAVLRREPRTNFRAASFSLFVAPQLGQAAPEVREPQLGLGQGREMRSPRRT